jgi:hypothetical protein
MGHGNLLRDAFGFSSSVQSSWRCDGCLTIKRFKQTTGHVPILGRRKLPLPTIQNGGDRVGSRSGRVGHHIRLPGLRRRRRGFERFTAQQRRLPDPISRPDNPAKPEYHAQAPDFDSRQGRDLIEARYS